MRWFLRMTLFTCFVLGMIAGISLCAFLAVIVTRHRSQLDVFTRNVERVTLPQAEVIRPRTMTEKAKEQLIRRNDLKGLPTNLSEIL